ncbi:S1C family serine protease [Streptomyces sp. NPDC057445]|uniref:S1C family serine protease n=1 Tax=Streptomyces sp. NPDC057445 TaxID=3346136 RepID=UPI0036A20F68
MDISRARAVALMVAGGCAVALAGGCYGGRTAGPESTTQAAPPAVRGESGLETDYRTVIRNVLPSVVQIEAGDRVGSGIVYDANGHIVTNAHVIDSEKDFKVTLATGDEPVAASLVAAYPEQDLAVVRLDRVPAGLKPPRFGDSADVEVGHIVLAMGSPLGLSGSVTQGIVSAVGRTVSETPEGGGVGATIGNMVQTSAAINPGNSGGALVNLNSEVIGIPTLAATDPGLGDAPAPGIGFAIPVSMVRTVADQIIRYGKVTDSGRAALSVRVRTVLGNGYEPSGVALVEVAKDGPADRAGLRIGDIITRLGDDEITTITSLAEALASDRPGQKVKVTYQRDGKQRTAEVRLGKV